MTPQKSKEQSDIERLQKQLLLAERVIRNLESKINFLERENNRRKNDLTSIAGLIKR